ncbi:hypothetical protein [Pseudomonas jilinensis]|uniref:Phage tail protein n=1 Tax=Pseudomonas jilinensis TaxID=2078689 RepID=A0A396RZ05_9PSED|nr:hypothetical protein [Pseudomonas jilinensis]RHW21699.1 hypothetical protein C2846_07040 [Pseudomonas jilinensis]
MWAQIQDGTVAEITAINPTGRFHPSLVWIACSSDIEPGWTYVNDEFSPPTVAPMSVEDLCNQIDHTADTARALVVGDPLRAEEYKTAREEAQAFAAGGYQGDVPRAVAAWAINGRTAQQAADEILAEAAAWTEALYFIRETRLAAKEQVRELMAAEQPEQAQAAAEQAIAAINAAIAGVGNAAN